MTTYYREYKLTVEQKFLLRDLLVYYISTCDSAISMGETSPFIALRSKALEFLLRINDDDLGGDDSTMIMMEDIAKLCNPVSKETRNDYLRTCLKFEGDSGLIGILTAYDNDIISSLRSELTDGELEMRSTNSFFIHNE